MQRDAFFINSVLSTGIRIEYTANYCQRSPAWNLKESYKHALVDKENTTSYDGLVKQFENYRVDGNLNF